SETIAPSVVKSQWLYASKSLASSDFMIRKRASGWVSDCAFARAPQRAKTTNRKMCRYLFTRQTPSPDCMKTTTNRFGREYAHRRKPPAAFAADLIYPLFLGYLG